MSPQNALRRNGACYGALYKQHTSVTVPPNLSHLNLKDEDDAESMDALVAALDSNERGRSHDFCVLVGNTLISYESWHCYRRGDHPTSEVRIVGASAWNPPVPRGSAAAAANAVFPSLSPSHGSQPSLGTPQSIPGQSPFAAPPSGPPTFRIVTYAGTHIYCSAPTPADRDTWLAALHSGLEASYASYHETLSSITASPGGTRKKHLLPLSVVNAANEQKILTPPVPQRRINRLGDALRRRATSHDRAAGSGGASVPISSHGYLPPYESGAALSSKHCISCARYPPETAYRPLAAPLPQYGMECRVDLCADCLVSQGLLCHVNLIAGLYSADAHERAALTKARDLAIDCVEVAVRELAEQAERDRMIKLEERRRYEEEVRAAALEVGAREIGADGMRNPVRPILKVAVEEDEAMATATATASILAHAASLGDAEASPDEHHGEDDSGESRPSTGASSDDYVHCSNDGASGGTGESWTNVNSDADTLVLDATDDAKTAVPTIGSSAILDAATSGANARSSGTTSLSASWDYVPRQPAPPPPAFRFSDNTPNRDAWINLPPAAATTTALLRLISSSQYLTLRRRSRVLDMNCRMLEGGGIGCAAEFLEILNEHAREACASTAVSGEEIGMKKEAFKVAGDMGAAVRMLRDFALPNKKKPDGGTGGGLPGGSGVVAGNNTEMLACVLEFLLDLCDEGELNAVAFFWPQIRQIHLRMLPPTDAGSLVRVELVEDFLLTVCVRHSVHLTLETVWGCVADLEESLGSPSTSGMSCRRRRYAVLRFVCELESLLFDFDGGWGGGNVSLKAMLSPSEHQAALIRESFAMLQLHRRFGSHHLSRSVRLEKLRREAEKEEEEVKARSSLLNDMEDGSSSDEDDDPSSIRVPTGDPNDSPGLLSTTPIPNRKRAMTTESMAQRSKMRIARNADYFSSHFNFSRRLGDIAERLRFMDVEKRSTMLEKELGAINAAGRKAMGGDPLNMLCAVGEGLLHVVHIPTKEGHVFRSKERTPVLLLMEMVREKGLPEGRSRREDEDSSVVSSSECTEDDSEGVATEEDDEDVAPLPVPAAAPSLITIEQESGSENSISENCPAPSSVMGNGADELLLSPKPAAGALKHFESPARGSGVIVSGGKPGSPKTVEAVGAETMGDLVASIMENKLIDLPDLSKSCNTDASESNALATDEVEADAEGDVEADCEGDNYVDDDDDADDDERLKEAFDSGQPRLSHPSGVDGSNDRLPEASLLPFKKSRRHRSAKGKKYTSAPRPPRTRMSAFGSMFTSPIGPVGGDLSAITGGDYSMSAQGRREVLTAIFVKGMRSSNLIARGAAPAAQRAVQAMDRQRAVELLNMGRRRLTAGIGDTGADRTVETEDEVSDTESGLSDDGTGAGIVVGFGSGNSGSLPYSTSTFHDQGIQKSGPTEEDEAMEALRLLIIQNRVAQGNLSPEHAAMLMGGGSEAEGSHRRRTKRGDDSGDGTSMDEEFDDDDALGGAVVDAGDVDRRLAGCGPLSRTVHNALKLWQAGTINNVELLDLVQKDLQYLRHSALPGAANESKLKEDSAFWGRFAFGERWAEKKARIQTSSPHGTKPGWDLAGVIVKSNDDLRQEAFVMQLIQLCQEAFAMGGLELWVHPYRILATGRTTGFVECVRNAMSFDSLKKRPGYANAGGLRGHFRRMTEYAADPSEAFETAQKNFVRSLAAYSLMSYLFMFKDRHNGNILLDTAGHVIHIDFGFVFGIAPGGSFSLEQSVPFKLTEEMIDVMGGLRSPLFTEFVTLFCCGFLALQAHMETFLTIVEVTCQGSTYKCFEGRDPSEIVTKLRERFCPDLDREATVAYALDLIKYATTAYGTKQYDYFQYLSQGIAS